ncbi:Tail-anchored protein insertion receptor WRB [Melipona quadrifasciata]|uniref:Guided entry of tail-anchored proteins factor 1 n=1 Tax=Melipona quadrifasciata TaxID=166423 RepID=A0A0M8ZNS5_9HYME|nr:Tail-anchored protein insertion receptor WRB [Melipona quadrifasciata]
MNLFIISTVSCLLEYIFPSLIRYITSRLYTLNKHDMELRKNLVHLEQEMTRISIVDEFSKYAKLQRKYNKLESTLKEKVNERLSSRMKMQISVTYGFRMLNGLLMFILLYLYRNKPVIILPKGILWPIQNLLSWPCYHEDSISLIMWLIIARLVVATCKI